MKTKKKIVENFLKKIKKNKFFEKWFFCKNIGFVTQLKRDKNGPFLTVVPHESKKTNVDPRDFWNNNYKNILVMKETAEKMWSIDIPSIKIACARDEITIKKAIN